MKVADVLAQYTPGDPWGWSTEFAGLWADDTEHMLELVADINDHGFNEPILLGNDGRVWDGHHRLAVAAALLIEGIPTREAGQ